MRTRGEGDASAVWTGHRRALIQLRRPGRAAGRVGWGLSAAHARSSPSPWMPSDLARWAASG